MERRSNIKLFIINLFTWVTTKIWISKYFWIPANLRWVQYIQKYFYHLLLLIIRPLNWISRVWSVQHLIISQWTFQWSCRLDTIISMFVATADDLAAANTTLLSNWNLKSSVRPNIYVPKSMRSNQQNKYCIRATGEMWMEAYLFSMRQSRYSLIINEAFLTSNMEPALWCWSLRQVFTTQI